MALFMLARRKPSSVILPIFFSSGILPRFSSTSTTQNPDPNFRVEAYLVSSFGFNPDKAAKISKPLLHLKSPDQPDAVLHLLRHQGFSQPDINKLITWFPSLLCSSPEKTLLPNLQALRDMGLSDTALTQIILSNPPALQLRAAVPRINFWRNFFAGDEAALVKAFKGNRGIITNDITGAIEPKIALLQSHGLSTAHIQRILLTISRFITHSADTMEDLLKRTKELGFQPGSGMFVRALESMTWTTREAFREKMELLKSFGWSESEFHSAWQKFPPIVTLTERTLKMKMDFLVGEVKCEPSYIASHPLLLGYSLEKRMRPRYRVLHRLESVGLSDKGWGFIYAIHMNDKQFVEKYIVPHMNEVSGLHGLILLLLLVLDNRDHHFGNLRSLDTKRTYKWVQLALVPGLKIQVVEELLSWIFMIIDRMCYLCLNLKTFVWNLLIT